MTPTVPSYPACMLLLLPEHGMYEEPFRKALMAKVVSYGFFACFAHVHGRGRCYLIPNVACATFNHLPLI